MYLCMYICIHIHKYIVYIHIYYIYYVCMCIYIYRCVPVYVYVPCVEAIALDRGDPLNEVRNDFEAAKAELRSLAIYRRDIETLRAT